MTTAISNLSATWTDAGVTYNAISMNVTTGGYATNSTAFIIKANGTPLFTVRPGGTIYVSGNTYLNATGTTQSGDGVQIGNTAANGARIRMVEAGNTLYIQTGIGYPNSARPLRFTRYKSGTPVLLIDMANNDVSINTSFSNTELTVAGTITADNLDITQNITANSVTANTINAINYYISGSPLTSIIPNTVVQFYNVVANSAWTKPVGRFKQVKIQAWGGGGSGGRGGDSTSEGGGGGGGGGYFEYISNYDDIASTGWANVGAGGISQTASNGDGFDGKPSIFAAGDLVIRAYGGGGGQGRAGRGGGGAGLAGSASANGAGTFGGVEGLITTDGRNSYPGHLWGGGAGGAGEAGSAATYGGPALWGGAGGAGGSDTGTIWVGGVSLFGGNGGAGAKDTTPGSLGQQPGGGGGGAENAATGAGGNGQIIITTF